MPLVPARRLSSHRRRLLFGATVLWHASLALRPLQPGHRGRQVLVRVATVCSDVVVTTRLDGRSRRTAAVRLGLESLGAWAWSLDSPVEGDTNRGVYSAAASAHAAEAGFSATFGPDRAAGMLPAAVRTLLPVLAPAVAAGIAKRGRGQPAQLGLAWWGLVAGAGGIVFGSYLERLDRRNHRAFVEETAPRLALEREVAALMVRTKASPAHDFKKTLLSLGMFGSTVSWEAATSQARRPGLTASGISDGHHLYEAARALGLWVHPPAAARVWVADAQIAALRDVVQRTDDLMGDHDGRDTSLVVREAYASSLVVEYRGRRAVIDNPAPKARVVVDSIPLIVGVAAFWKYLELLADRPEATRKVLMTAATGLDLGVAAIALVVAPSSLRTRTAFASLLLTGSVFDLARTWRRRGSSPTDVKGPGTNGLMGTNLLLSTCWTDVGPWRAPASVALAALWLVTDVAWSGGAANALQGVLWPVQMFVTTFDLEGGWRRESEDASRALEADLAEQLAAVRRNEARSELEYLAGLLAVARSELARLDGVLDRGLAELIAQDCDELERWLATPGRAEWLCAY